MTQTEQKQSANEPAKPAQADLFDNTPFAFGPGFLRDHAGHIMADPRIAVVELIANAYDAGATEVTVQWPDQPGGQFEIADNGTGMTAEEFNRGWKTLNYNRSLEQGSQVEFPSGSRAAPRVAFGQSGKGRHGAFCFADVYEVETWRDGIAVLVKVALVDGGREPFHCSILESRSRDGHGTRVSATITRKFTPAEQIGEWVGSKFLVDPDFSVILNRRPLALMALPELETTELDAAPFGRLLVHQIEAAQQDRTTRLRGITWWVHKRMVGQPSWSGLEQQGAVLDGRTAAAKRVSFVVEADCLKPDVKQDWSGFHDSDRSLRVREVARDHVIRALDALLSTSRKERKKNILAEHRAALGELPVLSKRVVGRFIDRGAADLSESFGGRPFAHSVGASQAGAVPGRLRFADQTGCMLTGRLGHLESVDA